MRYTNRADLLIAAGESIKMQEKAGIEPVYKSNGAIKSIDGLDYSKYSIEFYDREFPLAVVEGKPVFVGDELWIIDDECLGYGKRHVMQAQFSIENPKRWSWNPPKPKTIMVELLVEDVKLIANRNYVADFGRLAKACHKALGETK